MEKKETKDQRALKEIKESQAHKVQLEMTALKVQMVNKDQQEKTVHPELMV